MSDIAGRYYALGKDVQDDDNLVNVIAERARRTGVVGEVGIKAMGLMLGGLMSGTRVPKITVSFGFSSVYRRRG